MAEATVATMSIKRLMFMVVSTAQVAFNGELCDLITNSLQIGISQILDFFGVRNATGLANLAGAGATDAENSGQANLGMLLRRNIDASDTCHVRPLEALAD